MLRLTLILPFCCALMAAAASLKRTADVVVYGATPAGLAAGVSASREGVSVVVIEPTTQIGGMLNGCASLRTT